MKQWKEIQEKYEKTREEKRKVSAIACVCSGFLRQLDALTRQAKEQEQEAEAKAAEEAKALGDASPGEAPVSEATLLGAPVVAGDAPASDTGEARPGNQEGEVEGGDGEEEEEKVIGCLCVGVTPAEEHSAAEHCASDGPTTPTGCGL
jgi:hypothetical protein